MKARQVILLIISIAIVAGSVGAARSMIGAKKPQEKNDASATVKTVSTTKVANTDVQSSIPVTGKLVAEKRVELFAEVSGMLQSQGKVFKEGNRFGKGQVLLSIDGSEFGMSILSQKSTLLNTFTQLLPDIKIDFPESFDKWNDYLKGFEIEAPLPELPEIPNEKEKYFLSSRNIFGQYYNIKSLEEKLAKYTIRAPFDGVVVTSMIDPGTNVRAGQKLGDFIAPSSYELEVAVNLKDLELLKLGDKVSLTSPDLSGSWTGTIKRISNKIDDATQTVRVFVVVKGSELKEGMYLSGQIASELIADAMEIPRKLLVEKDEVLLVVNNTIKTHKVEVVKYGSGTAIVKGLPDGADLLQGTLIGAYDGMTVRKMGSK